MGKSDHATVQAVLAGNKEAYGKLVALYSRTVFAVAYHITGNEADAEEVVQDAFLRGYRKLDSFESRASFGTWIYRIAVRCALDRIALRRPDAAVRIDESLLTNSHHLRLLLTDALGRTVGEITDIKQAVFTLHRNGISEGIYTLQLIDGAAKIAEVNVVFQ